MTLRRNRRGTTSIEYGLIATLIGVALIVSLSQLAGVVQVLYAASEAMVSAAI